MLTKALHLQEILNALQSECCCGRHCAKQFSIESLKYIRYKLWSKTRQMRAQWILQTLRNGKKTGRFLHLTMENGMHVCRRSFLKLCNLDKNMLVRCRKLIAKDTASFCAKKSKSNSPPVVKSISWLEEFASCAGDRMPDSKLILLPHKTTKSSVYETYKEDIQRENGVPVSISTFRNIWMWHFPDLRMKKVWHSILIISIIQQMLRCTTHSTLSMIFFNFLFTIKDGYSKWA